MHICTHAANLCRAATQDDPEKKNLLSAVVHLKRCRKMTKLLRATCFKQVPPKLVNHTNLSNQPQRVTWQLETWSVVRKMENHEQGMSSRGPGDVGLEMAPSVRLSLQLCVLHQVQIYSCCHWLSAALKSRNYWIFRAKQREERALLPCVCSQVSHES